MTTTLAHRHLPLTTSNARVLHHIPKPARLDHTAILWTEHIDGYPVVTIHSSGAGGSKVAPAATVGDVVSYIHALVATYRPHVLTTTESTQRGLVQALRHTLGRHYSVRKAGEYLCIVDTRVAVHRLRPAVLRRMTDIPDLVDWRNLFIGDFRVKILARPKIRYAVSVGHVASGVEDGDHYRTDRPEMVAANRLGLAAWGDWMDRLHSRLGRVICSARGDINLDLRDEVWREHVGKSLGGRTIWDHHQPTRGSHGPRLIDAGLLREGGRA